MSKIARIVYIHNEAEEIGGTSLSLNNMLHSLKGLVEPIIVLRSYGPVYDFFSSQSYECIVLPFRFNYISCSTSTYSILYIAKLIKNRWLCARAVKGLYELLKDRNIDIVHTNSSVIDIGLSLAKKLSVPHFWHIREFIDKGLHISPIWGYKHWIKTISSSQQVIVISPSLHKHLLHAYPSGLDNMTQIYDAVLSSERKMLNTNKEKYILFLSGRIHPIKNPKLAIDIFRLSSLATRGYKLKFVGRCEEAYKRELLEYSKAIEDSLIFEDFSMDIEKDFANASAFLMCSQYEGLGRVSIEAMYYGTAVLALNSGASRDIIEDGVTGYLFDNEREAAKKLQDIVANEQSSILKNAQDYVLSEFTEEVFRSKLSTLYNRYTDDRS